VQAAAVALGIGIVGMATSAVLGTHGVRHLRQLEDERQHLGEEAVGLLQRTAALREEISHLRSDDDHLEGLARRELHLVRPDEIVYRFRRPTAPAGAPAPDRR
jgi:cell division protein FtsB